MSETVLDASCSQTNLSLLRRRTALQRLQHPHKLTLNSCDSLGLDDRNAGATAGAAVHPQVGSRCQAGPEILRGNSRLVSDVRRRGTNSSRPCVPVIAATCTRTTVRSPTPAAQSKGSLGRPSTARTRRFPASSSSPDKPPNNNRSNQRE